MLIWAAQSDDDDDHKAGGQMIAPTSLLVELVGRTCSQPAALEPANGRHRRNIKPPGGKTEF